MNEAVSANYEETPVPLYKGNPMIEALPREGSMAELYEKLCIEIPYSKQERAYPARDRREMVQQIYHAFQPWGTHIDLVNKFSSAIRGGYIGRCPLNPEFLRTIEQLSERIQKKDSSFLNFRSSNPGAPGFAIVGASGSGKTSAVKRILTELYPQKILHTEYKGAKFQHLQITWMLLTCPHDGSVKGLCVEFFREFDRITGEHVADKFAKTTKDVMLMEMALLARRHSIGALVIDEIQNISLAKSGGKEQMLSFLANMMDVLSIPIIVVGIPSAISLLSESFMTARRVTGQQGMTRMSNLPFDGGDWEIFITGIWHYQWTASETELTPELSSAMYQCSKGNVSLAVFLYALVQRRIIDEGFGGGSEIITEKQILDAAQSGEFHLYSKTLMDCGEDIGKSNAGKKPSRAAATSERPAAQSARSKPKKTKSPDLWSNQEAPTGLLEKNGLLGYDEE